MDVAAFRCAIALATLAPQKVAKDIGAVMKPKKAANRVEVAQ